MNSQAPEDGSMDKRQTLAEDTLDGNVAGGALAMIFGADVTAVPGRCGHCGVVNMVGAMRAYVQAPGMVLRCPACDGVVLRVVETPDSTYVDLRGVAYLRFERSAGSP
jgi:hypothetical protein